LFQVSPREVRRFFLSLLNVIDNFRGRNPALRINIEYRHLDALRIILGKKAQIHIAYLDFGPHAFGQHFEEPDITIILHVEGSTEESVV